MNEPVETEFLTLDDVLELHNEMISAIGGSYGVLAAAMVLKISAGWSPL